MRNKVSDDVEPSSESLDGRSGMTVAEDGSLPFESDEKKLDEVFGRRVPLWVKVTIAVGIVAVIVVSLGLGRYNLSPLEVVQTLWNSIFDPQAITDPKAFSAVVKIRLPRIIIVMLVGAALSIAGASYQGMFKNPMVSPDILGASAGASLGAAIGIIYGFPNIAVQIFAFAGGLIAVGLATAISRSVRYDAILGLILGGILVSSLFQAGTSLLKLVADANNQLPELTFWLMGSFNDVNVGDLLLILAPMAIGFALLFTQSWKLNVLSFGDEEARSMGINTKVTRLIVILASTLVSSITVSVAGIIGWVGLVIPHLARAIVGPNYKVLLPVSTLIGAGFLVIVDDFARCMFPAEIPIGILTAILGVPFFIFIFKRNMSGW
ncbi:MAG: FecCD family ABC transporter permease [Coriobacteriales bacterium]|jgi:iron complex transport system permease protein